MQFLLGLLIVAGAPAPTSERGSTLHFHGWSPDSRLVAYTRSRAARTRPDQRMHRFVDDGRFTGFGRMVGRDVARYAVEHGYRAQPAPRRKIGEMAYEFALGRQTLTLHVEVAQAQRWRVMRGGHELARHRFDRIYVGFEIELYPSPDGRQAVLVMHLDTGWEIDAAIFPLPLTAR